MNNMEELRESFDFALKHNLTRKEMELILFLLEGDKSTKDITEHFKISRAGINQMMMVLRLKGLVEMKDKTLKGMLIYKLKTI